MDLKTVDYQYIASQIESIDIIIHFTADDYLTDNEPDDYLIDNEPQIQNFEPTCFVDPIQPKFLQDYLYGKEYSILFCTNNYCSIFQVLKCHGNEENEEYAWMIFMVNGIVYLCRCRIVYIFINEEQRRFDCYFYCVFSPENIIIAKDKNP